MTTPPVALAEVTRQDERGGRLLVESRHLGHVAITIDGAVVLAAGDVDGGTFLRSTVKPVQVRVCLELLAEAGWPSGQLTTEEIAVSWASHRGEPAHLDAVRALCDRAGILPDQLGCPPDRRLDGPADDLSRVQHNCSGKHALFALAGASMGVGGVDLLRPDGAMQQRMLRALDTELGGLQGVGTDGCGAPAVRASLTGLAALFGRIAAEPAWQTIRDAGFAHPLLVGGTGRLETALLATGTVAKFGAEGLYAAGWVQDGRTVGVAVKCDDGAARGADTALAAIAASAGRDLAGWTPQVSYAGGRVVGGVRCDPGLEARATEVFA